MRPVRYFQGLTFPIQPHILPLPFSNPPTTGKHDRQNFQLQPSLHPIMCAVRHISQYVQNRSDLFCHFSDAPRPWGMQPNTSFRLRMCISPLMSKSKLSKQVRPFLPLLGDIGIIALLLPRWLCPSPSADISVTVNAACLVLYMQLAPQKASP